MSGTASANSPSRGRSKKEHTGTLAKYEEEVKNDNDKNSGSTIVKRNNNFMQAQKDSTRGGSMPISQDETNKLEENVTSAQQPVMQT